MVLLYLPPKCWDYKHAQVDAGSGQMFCLCVLRRSSCGFLIFGVLFIIYCVFVCTYDHIPQHMVRGQRAT